MIGDIIIEFCGNCRADTDHEQGCFKYKKVADRLFHLDATTSDLLQNVSDGFKDQILDEGGAMDADYQMSITLSGFSP